VKSKQVDPATVVFEGVCRALTAPIGPQVSGKSVHPSLQTELMQKPLAGHWSPQIEQLASVPSSVQIP